MLQIIKKFWGLLPVAVALVLQITVKAFEINDMILKSKPSCIVYWITIFLFLLFAAWVVVYLYQRLRAAAHEKKITYGFSIGFVCIVAVVTVAMAVLSSFIAFPVQKDIERNGIKMVGTVRGETEVYVDYYEDKGTWFRSSKILGQAEYGETPYNPFDDYYDIKPKRYTFYDKEGNVLENYDVEIDGEL